MGAALSSVKSLHCNIQDSSGSSKNAAVLVESLRNLAVNLPVLQHLILGSSLSSSTLKYFGLACKSLTSLTLQADEFQHISRFMHSSLLQLQSLLPKLKRLSIPNLALDSPQHAELLRPLSQHTGIESLDLSRTTVRRGSIWSCMSPHVRYLLLDQYLASAPDFPVAGASTCSGLLTLELGECAMDLSALAELLRAAPALSSLHQGSRVAGHVQGCGFCMIVSSRVWRSRGGVMMDVGRTGSQQDRHGWTTHVDALPAMTEVRECRFTGRVLQGRLVNLARVFPAVRKLTLHKRLESNSQLEELGVCDQLTHLTLVGCPNISTMALSQLLLALPALEVVTYQECSRLLHCDAGEFVRVLSKNGQQVRVTCMDAAPGAVLQAAEAAPMAGEAAEVAEVDASSEFNSQDSGSDSSEEDSS
ncbi:MAG: hypothetical protein WDW38_003572 [Sanguina aurantia]